MKKLVVSLALCAALIAPANASAPDEGTSASASHAPAVAWDPQVTEKAKALNAANPFMLLHQLPYQMIFTNLFAVGGTEELTTLLTSCHKLHDQLSHIGVRTAFREVLKAHPEAGKLDPWAALLFHKDAKVQHLIWARQMLLPQNLEQLGKIGLLGKLSAMPAKAKALALAAHAADFFRSDMHENNQSGIISYALHSSRPLSDYAALVYACKTHLFTEKMGGLNSEFLIIGALQSPRPLSDYAALGSACREHLFMEDVDGVSQVRIIRAALQSPRPLSDYAALGSACREHLFTEKMDEQEQVEIISYALHFSRPLSDYAALASACKHLFTDKMNGYDQAKIITSALKSSRLLSEYAAVVAACKAHLFIAGMKEWEKAEIIAYVLPLSDTQMHQLVRECAERAGDDRESRRDFIRVKAWNLLARK